MTDTDTLAAEMLTLREANVARQREWDAGSQLTLAFRGNELAGEVGEACNVIKKLERERLGIKGSRDTVAHLAEELADVVICTDLIAMAEGIDLDAAVADKFNATSWKVGLQTRLASPTNIRALLSERAAMKAELTRLREGVDTLIESLTSLSGGAYCRSLEQHSKTECLGEEYKLKNGLFGAAELSGHRKAAELLGQHIGMASAVRAIRAALKGADHDPT